MSDRRLISVWPLLLLLVAMLVAGGCGKKDEQTGDVLARVGDRVITADYYAERLGRLQQDQLPRDDDGQVYDMASVEGKRQFLEIIIDKELMVSKALQLGYQNEPQAQAGMEQLREYHGMIYFWQDEIGDPSRFVSDADLDYYYSRLGETRSCTYVITDTRAEAEAARQDALSGMSWSELARQHHYVPGVEEDRLKVRIGWGTFRDDFQRPVFAVAQGELTEPIETEYGWWVLRVDEVTFDSKPELEGIKAEVLASIAKRKEAALRDDLVAKVRQQRNYMMDEEVLRIVYQGLPEGETLIDPATQQPLTREQLRPLEVSSTDLGRVLMGYDLASGRVELTVADIKAQFDRQNIFDRPRKEEGIGALRTKLRSTAERALMTDEARRRGFMQDPRVEHDSMKRIEELLVDRVHTELLSYDEFVSLDQLQEFWADHAEEYHKSERRSGNMIRAASIEMAREARAALLDGSLTWRQAIRSHNNDPELVRTLGKLTQVSINSEGTARDVLFTLGIGEISQPIEVPGGWAVIQLERVHAAEQPTLEEMREAVAQRIKNRRMDAALRQLLAQWRAEFGVTVYEERLAGLPSWEEAVQAANLKQLGRPAGA